MKDAKSLVKKAMRHKGALHFEIHVPVASGSMKDEESKAHEKKESKRHEKSEGKMKERMEKKMSKRMRMKKRK